MNPLGTFPDWLIQRPDFTPTAVDSPWLMAVKKPRKNRTYKERQDIIKWLKSDKIFDVVKMDYDSLSEAIEYKEFGASLPMCKADEAAIGSFYYIIKGEATYERTGNAPPTPQNTNTKKLQKMPSRLHAHSTSGTSFLEQFPQGDDDEAVHAVRLGPGDTFGSFSPELRGISVCTIDYEDSQTTNLTGVVFVHRYTWEEKVLWENINLLRKTALFESWSRNRLLQLVKRLVCRSYRPDTVITKHGDEADRVYFVKSGVCVVQKENHIVKKNRWPKGRDKNGEWSWGTYEVCFDKPEYLTKLETGDVFGELAVLNGKPRSATVKTETETTILELSKEDFLQLVTGKVRKTLELQVNKMYKTPAQMKAASRGRTDSKDLPNPTRCKQTVIINTDDVSKNNKEKLSRQKLIQELHPALVTMLTKGDGESVAGTPPLLIMSRRKSTKLPSISSKYAQR